MARRKQSVPSYLLHKPTGQARVRVNGHDIYLGRYDSPESRAEYARIIAELAVRPTPSDPDPASPASRNLTVNELLLGFWEYADRYYRRADGTPTNELPQFKQTFRLLRELYGHTPAREFGPLALKAVRQKMIEKGWNRKLVNQRVGRVRRAFRWATENELVPVAVHQALGTVAGLKAGRTDARELDPVLPVADEHVRATLPFLGPVVRGMVEVQLLTGMRPGEVCQLCPCDIDTSEEVWVFRPRQFKTRHRGKARVVAIGPKARAVLERLTPADPAGHYFDPRRTVAEFRAARTAARKTPCYASHMARNAAVRVKAPKRPPADRYTVSSYGHAVARAVEKVNRRRERLAEAGNYDPVPHWHPNQLRHAHGTEVRRRFGLEAAQVALGHERADVTQVYAEKNLALAAKVAAEIG